MSRLQADKAVQDLASDDPARRLAGAEALWALAPYGVLMNIGLTPEQGLAVLRAALRSDWPSPTASWEDPWCQRLLCCLCSVPHPQYLPILLEHIDLLDGWIKWQALMLLSNMPQREAAECWIPRYRALLAAGKGSPPPLAGLWAKEGLHADLVLPALLEFASTAQRTSDDGWLADQLESHIGNYLRHGNIEPDVIRSVLDAFDSVWSVVQSVRPERIGNRWKWKSDYIWPRHRASDLMVSLGRLPLAQASDRISQAIHHPDPRIAASAIIAALRHSLSVSKDDIQRVAADPEIRAEFRSDLIGLKKGRLFPRKWASQACLAESDMIEWWVNDGGEGPDEIFPMGVVDRSDGRYHVFRMIWGSDSAPGDKEEFAGISGPWPTELSANSRRGVCNTFSLQEPPGQYSAEEHVERTLAVLAATE